MKLYLNTYQVWGALKAFWDLIKLAISTLAEAFFPKNPLTKEKGALSMEKGCGSPSSRKSVEATVLQSETRVENKKFTVYKVVVSTPLECWFVYRRYNEFHKLQDTLKRAFGGQSPLKLPGKKLFGNNFDPQFVAARKLGLDAFLQQLISNPDLVTMPVVKEFLQIDGHLDGKNAVDEVDLGPSESTWMKPSNLEFLHVIGKGSFGKVILARSRRNRDEYFAVKVLSKRLLLQQTGGPRHIMSERSVLLKTLNHPFIVSLKCSFQTREKLYFLLDFVQGGELLFHLQKQRTFPEPQARFYAAEIASALGFLHSKGILYRDLKPENILLNSEGHVVLTDFGLSKEGLFPKDTTDTFCGTPEYLAPEVLRKEPYDKSVDWWCLGAVLYEMLNGLPPFYSSNHTEMYKRILQKPLPLKASLSEVARSILSQLLDKNPENRLGSGFGDFEEVQRHEFFSSINWTDLLALKIQPPFKPYVKNKTDVSNFESSFTQEDIASSISDPEESSLTVSVEEADDTFKGFSYAPGSEAATPHL